MNMMPDGIAIVTPYRNVLPPLSTDERESLRASIEIDGYHDWEPCLATEDGRLLDGHNRRELFPEAPIVILPDTAEWDDLRCRAWILSNADPRRNLSPDQKAEKRKAEIEIAKEYLHHGWTQDEVGRLLKKSRQWVTKYTIVSNATGSKTNAHSKVKVPSKDWDIIKQRHEDGETQEQIAADYGVTRGRIAQIIGKGKGNHAQRIGNGNQPGCTISDLDDLVRRGCKFGTVYADPPWQYGNQATRASTDNHYHTMTIEEISALPIGELVAERSHCHLWTTNGFLREAFQILEAWGFEYKSCFVWVKPQMGIGNYWRVSHEFMLLGVRGQQPFEDKGLMSWLNADRGQHSAKPEQVRLMIEKASPGDRLELFGRSAVPGWTVWGNEVSRDLFTASIPVAGGIQHEGKSSDVS